MKETWPVVCREQFLDFRRPSYLIYIAWCAVYQLDLVIKHIIGDISKKCFREPLLRIIPYLRRQNLLRYKMVSTFPSISTTRWAIIGRAVTWWKREKISFLMRSSSYVKYYWSCSWSQWLNDSGEFKDRIEYCVNRMWYLTRFAVTSRKSCKLLALQITLV